LRDLDVVEPLGGALVEPTLAPPTVNTDAFLHHMGGGDAFWHHLGILSLRKRATDRRK